MSGFIKDDLTVALDEVDRIASRIITIFDDLSAIASAPSVAERLRERAEAHRRALVRFNLARRSAGHTPEVADPERAHLQSLWLALKSAVAGEHSEDSLQESLAELDAQLRETVDAAVGLHPEPDILAALQDLRAESQPSI